MTTQQLLNPVTLCTSLPFLLYMDNISSNELYYDHNKRPQPHHPHKPAAITPLWLPWVYYHLSA